MYHVVCLNLMCTFIYLSLIPTAESRQEVQQIGSSQTKDRLTWPQHWLVKECDGIYSLRAVYCIKLISI